MTACRNKASRAVTAALVGVLSVGAVPMVAMAAETDGASLMSVESDKAFAAGELTKAHDGKGHLLSTSELESLTFEVGNYLVPTVVTPNHGTAQEINTSADGNPADNTATVEYLDSNKSHLCWAYEAGSQSWIAGTYYARVAMTAGDYNGGILDIKFTVANKSIESATIFDNSNGDVSDTTFTYNGQNQTPTIGVMLDGKVLTPSEYVLKVVKAGSGSSDAEVQAKDAGSYTVCIWGQGAYAGSYVALPLEIGVLDLATADVTVGDVTDAVVPHIITVNGYDFDTKWDNVRINVDGTVWDYGPYTATVSAGDTKNVTGSKQVTFNRVGSLVADSTITYDGTAVDGQKISVLIDTVSTYFDLSKLSVNGMSDDLYTVTVTKADGSAATVADINRTAGVYKVSVRVTDPSYNFGSNTVTMTVTTRESAINADASLYFTFDDEVVSGTVNPEYTGSDMLDRLGIVLEDEDGNALVEGDDYTVSVKDENGQAVDEIVDAGTYTVEVTSDTYRLDGDTKLTVDVDPRTLKDVYVSSDSMLTFGKTSFVSYTGEGIDDLYFYYLDENGDQVRIPEGVIEITSFNYDPDGAGAKPVEKDVTEVKEIGYYRPQIRLADNVKNYDFANGVNEAAGDALRVSDMRIFNDVNATDWYASYVYEAADLGYMTGYGANDGKFFGPTDTIKRGDVAMVLWNMAGQPQLDESGDWYSDQFGFVTGFDDVDGKAYYAQAIAWAKRLGIVSGDDNADTFRPEDSVTREELAKMLTVYSEKVGKDVTVDTDAVLSEYEDESTVSEWARDYVAYLVDQDVMGQDSGLKATDPISRAEVATMAVRLQPEHLDIELVPRS